MEYPNKNDPFYDYCNKYIEYSLLTKNDEFYLDYNKAYIQNTWLVIPNTKVFEKE
jgi:hypothetical protein